MSTVTIYSTPSCVYCKLAKEYFTEHQVPFVEKNVASDLVAQQEMISKTGQLAVPVIDINGTFVVGFDRPKIDQLLKAAAAAPKTDAPAASTPAAPTTPASTPRQPIA